MKRRLLFLLVFWGTTIYSWAYPASTSVKYDFTVDNIYYRYNADRQSVAVTYNNNGITYSFSSDNFPKAYSGDVVIPASVTYEGTIYPVTKIDMCAFLRCSDVTSVQLPSSIVEIGNSAFQGCSSLATINLPNNLTKIEDGAFSSCSALTSIVIPSSLETVNGFASSGLTSVTIPEGITAISYEAFTYCSSLETIQLPSSLKTIGARAFRECGKLKDITIPANVTNIGNYAFQNCTSLNSATLLCELREFDTETGQFLNVGNQNNGIFFQCGEIDLHIQNANTAITLLLTGAFNESWITNTKPRFMINNAVVTEFSIPNGITTIPAYSFCGVRGMTNVIFPSTLKTIGTLAFNECTNLSTLSFPDALESIGESAFRNCTALTTVNFGIGLQQVGEYAFQNCTNITQVDIGDLAHWCSIEFDVTHYNYESVNTPNPLQFVKKIYVNGSQLSNLTIPDGVTSIGALAFPKCQRFGTLTIPNSVKSIGSYAFAGCSDMDQIVFGSGLETIGSNAFRECTSLTSVSLPNSVTEIGASAFSGCSNLASITLPSGLTAIPAAMLYECKKLSSVTMPSRLVTIGLKAFESCTALTRIDIPRTVNSIETEAFKSCSGLTGVYIEDLAAWCGIDFGNVQSSGGWGYEDKQSNPLIYAKNLYLNNQLITDLVIPDGVVTIKPYTFWNATCLTSVQIPEGVKTIGRLAFELCSNLTSIKLPQSLESVETKAFECIVGSQKQTIKLYVKDLTAWFSNSLGTGFPNAGNYGHYNCLDLYVNEVKVTNLVVPKAITKLNKYDMACMNLNTVTLHDGIESLFDSSFKRSSVNTIYSQSTFAPIIYRENQETTETNALLNCSNLTAIYVPVGSGTRYKTKWSTHEAIIFETDTWPYGEEEPAVTVTVTNCERLYGAENPTFEYTVTGGDLNGVPVLSCTATETSPVGEYDITIAKGTISNTNYTLVPGKLTVNKAPLTITADNKSRDYGEENPELTCSYSGFVNGETNSVLTTQPTLATTATIESDAGTYEISVGGAEATNYEITNVYGTLTVNGKTIQLSITLSPNSFVYNGEEQQPTVSVTAEGVISLTAGTDYQLGGKLKATKGGGYTITAKPIGNYIGNTVSATWKIVGVTIFENGETVMDDGENVTLQNVPSEAIEEDGGVSIPEEITQIDNDAFDNLTNEQKATIQYVDLTNTSVSGITVDRESGLFNGFSDNTLICLPSGNNDGNEPNVVIGSTCGELVIEDGKAISLPMDFTAQQITYNRVLSSNDIYTLCLPYSLTSDDNVKFYKLTSSTSDMLVFSEVANTEENKPYLAVTGNTSSSLGKQVTTSIKKNTDFNGSEQPVTGYKMLGTMKTISHVDAIGKYIMQDDNMWHPIGANSPSTVVIPPFRGYIIGTTGGASRLQTVFEDDATGIRSIQTIDADGSIKWYDMNGRRLTSKPESKGVYIMNGKKVIK